MKEPSHFSDSTFSLRRQQSRAPDKSGSSIWLVGLVLSVLGNTALATELDPKVIATAERIRDEALAGTGAYALLESLTYEVGARLAGSAGDRRAVEWAQREFTARGFDNVRAEPVRVPQWHRGELTVRLPGIDTTPLVATMLGGSVGTPEAGIRAPLLRVESLAELTELDAERVAGHIVFIDQRMQASRTGAGYAATVGNRVRGASVAAERGALALAIRSVGTSKARIAHTGTMIYKPGVTRIPAVALAHADADRLAYLMAAKESVEMHVTSTARRMDSVMSANVMADIPGTAKDGEIVLVSAHLDSWDLGTGALDDGAGVAIVMQAAQLLKDQRPRPNKTIRVVLFANEEFGLSGSIAYKAAHQDELDRHALAMESDFGAGRVWQVASRVPAEGVTAVDAIAEILAPLGIERGGNKAFGGADIGRLRDAGVPVLALAQDGSRYFDYHHTVDDTLDKVDRQALDQNVAALAAVIYIAAAEDVSFGRLPVQETAAR